jgi:hypothetical protein
MANIFSQQRKKIVYLLVIFIALILSIWLIVQRDIFVKDPVVEEEIEILRRPKIDFSVLQLPQLKELQLLEEVPSVEEEVGRENPFLLY